MNTSLLLISKETQFLSSWKQFSLNLVIMEVAYFYLVMKLIQFWLQWKKSMSNKKTKRSFDDNGSKLFVIPRENQ